MQVLLVFNKEDPFIVTLKNAIIKCGSSVKCCRNIEETHEAFKKINYDLVFIDSRRTTANIQLHTTTTTNSTTTTSTSTSASNNQQQYDYENICCFIRNLFPYTVIVALIHHYEERDTPPVLPYLKIGFNKTFSETTSLIRCTNELLTLEYGEVSSVRRLQAAHALFTALEYTNDPIEILNDQFKLLYANSAFEKLTGLTLSEVSGKDFCNIHRIEATNEQQLHKYTTTPGNAWECFLPFPKSNGEIVNYSSLTIPVIVQGETNKVQNYVTITNLSKPSPQSSNRSNNSNSNNEETKKVTSFVLPKKSYDFDKFSLESSNVIPPANPTSKSSGANLSSSSNNEIITSASNSSSSSASQARLIDTLNFHLDTLPIEELVENNESNTTTTTTTTTPSSSVQNTNSRHNSTSSASAVLIKPNNSHSELTNVMNKESSTTATAATSKDMAQRKRSYDVHPPSHATESSTGPPSTMAVATTGPGGSIPGAGGLPTGGALIPRRHSMAKVHQQSIEAPIRKVINIICLAQENSVTDVVKQNLEKALEILRSTELYNPALIENDKHTSDLVSGLMSNGLQKRIAISSFLGPRPLLNYVTSTNQNYVKNLSPEITNLLDQDVSWSFDIISLERLSNYRPLLLLGLKIMNRFSVCEYLKIDESILVNWLTLIESNYRPGNPYHNSTHASDVLHASAYFLATDKLCEILDESDRVASLIAAAVHDLNHPGRTNAFLCNNNSDLAILYNDQAVLENHHVSLAFQLTRQNQDANIFKNLSRDEFRSLRSIIIDMVLATEMNKHFEHLNKFVNKFGITDDEKALPIKSVEMLKAPENKVLIKRMLIKCADVNNPCRPLDIYKEWTNRIANEYFQQTDEEKSKGLPVVMPTYDRASCNIPKAQISFIEYFINDMFEAWDDFIYLPELTTNLQANTVYWRECADALEQQSKQQSKPVATSTANEKKDRNDSIYEDNENEIDK